jgi:4-amino-4-deoxy-L-arabinose transferase-like glycosyltransferase
MHGLAQMLHSRYTVPLYLVFYFVLLALTSGTQLWDQDESAYAGMAINMLESGNWIIPEFDWSAVHRKTPFIYWNIVGCYQVVGITEFSVRLCTMLLVTASLRGIYSIARCFYDHTISLVAMVIMSTTLLFSMVGRIAVTDGTLFFFSIVCVYALFAGGNKKSWWLVLLFWGSFALATLTKGPPILLFTGTMFGLIYFFHPDRKRYIVFHPWILMPLACLPFAYWGYLSVQQDGGAFLKWLYAHYVVKRVNSSVFGQTGPPGTHLLFMLVTFIPYFALMPGAFREAYQALKKKDKTVLLLVFWFFSAWFIYELSPSKLPSYTLLAHPPLALLMARYATDSVSKSIRWIHLFLNFILVLAFIVSPFVFQLPSSIQISWPIAGVILLVLNGMVYYKFNSSALVYTIGPALFFLITITMLLMLTGDALKHNTLAVGKWCMQRAQKQRVLIGNDTGKPPSLPFYIRTHGNLPESEYQAAELVAACYEEDSAILVLTQKQAEGIQPFLDNALVHIIPSYRLETLTYYHYYLVQNRPIRSGDVPENLPPLSPPPSIEHYSAQMAASPEWVSHITEKARQKNLPIEKMIQMDAKYLHEFDDRVNKLLVRMRSSKPWLRYFNKKAQQEGEPLETIMLRQAKAIVGLGNFQ